MSQARLAVAAALLAACLTCAGVAQAAALNGAQAVAALNAQRTANGIPGDLVERTDWSAACRAHNRYMDLNGAVGQPEDPHRRGYSTQGAWAAQHAALGRDTWTAAHSPWDRTPIHLMQLLSPRLTQLGVSSSSHHVCATTAPGYLRPAPAAPSLYSFPGDGVGGVPYSQWSYGFPFTPGDFVGLPAGFTTGPNLLVMADVDGQARITGASLTGPGGPVEVRTVDNTADGVGATLPTGGVIIPVAPLEPGQAYTAAVTMVVGGAAFSRRAWTFSTGLADPATVLFVSSSISLDSSTRPPRITQGAIAVKTTSPAPVHMTIVAGGKAVAARDLADGGSWTPPQTPGSYQVCAHQDATGYYAAFDGCRPLTIRAQGSFSHRTTVAVKAALVGRYLRYKLTVTPALGRKVTLSARRPRGNGWHTFRTIARDANRVLTRKITARDTDTAVQVVVTVPSIRVGAEVYRAARVVKTIRRGG